MFFWGCILLYVAKSEDLLKHKIKNYSKDAF